MDTGEALGEEGGGYGSGGEALAGEGFVTEGEAVAAGQEIHRMDSGDLALAYGRDFRDDSERFLHYAAERLGGSGRGVQFMYMMDFLDGRSVVAFLEYL